VLGVDEAPQFAVKVGEFRMMGDRVPRLVVTFILLILPDMD
jgi:hypothetical protein